MKFFTKEETLVVGTILLFITLVTLYNLRISLRRARDAQRKSDMGQIAGALAKYREDFGFLPLSSTDHKILACEPVKQEGLIVKFSPCEWGKDKIVDLNDPNYPPYINSLPLDPQTGQGSYYVYLSNAKRFQILASLEGKDEDEYNPKIEARRISCGVRLCNFGVAYSKTPLDKSIEEYENEIREEGL